MLTFSLERVADLLEKAAEIELPEPALIDEDAEAAPDDAEDGSLAGEPAYQALREAVAALTPDEAYDILALALLERNSADPDEWQAMLERARETPEDEIDDEIIALLVETDDIELALARLGYGFDEDADEEESEQEAESDDDE